MVTLASNNQIVEIRFGREQAATQSERASQIAEIAAPTIKGLYDAIWHVYNTAENSIDFVERNLLESDPFKAGLMKWSCEAPNPEEKMQRIYATHIIVAVRDREGPALPLVNMGLTTLPVKQIGELKWVKEIVLYGNKLRNESEIAQLEKRLPLLETLEMDGLRK